jgi:hypothetical protein
MASIRLRGLESSAQFDQILRQIKSSNGLQTACTSGISVSDLNGSDCDIEATITFTCAKDQKHALDNLQKLIPLKFPDVKVDDDFMGITILASAVSSDAPFPAE